MDIEIVVGGVATVPCSLVLAAARLYEAKFGGTQMWAPEVNPFATVLDLMRAGF